VLIPLRDSIPTRRFPIVTVVIIVLNVVVFGYEITRPPTTLPSYPEGVPVQVSGFDEVTAEYGFVPCEVQDGCPQKDVAVLPTSSGSDVGHQVQLPAHPVWLTVFTAMFMHGGWLHIAGNMLFLWIFGNNVEDRMGWIGYPIFYIVAGIVAAATQFAVDPSSTVPVIGASGAIAGVMGAYLVLFPRARILGLIFIIPVRIQAFWFLGFWFVLQFFTSPNSGVAWVAHVGGFIFGALVALPLRHHLRPARTKPTWFYGAAA
jgi:membrane associated rhomboid family serine protease